MPSVKSAQATPTTFPTNDLNDSPREWHVDVTQEGCRVDHLLAKETGLPKQRIKDAMQKGSVWVTRGYTARVRRASRSTRLGDQIHLYYDVRILSENPTPSVLVADEVGYSIWAKPYGVRSQGSKWGDHCTVHRWAEQHLKPQRTAYTIHRLDRAAQGLILIAHKKSVASQLAHLFEKRDVEKSYVAIARGRFDVDTHSTRLDGDVEEKPALTLVDSALYSEDCDTTRLALRIETGRKHQIRRHLSDAGHPVVGDRLYGESSQTEDLQLYAVQLSFTCPLTGENRTYSLPERWLPSD